MEYWRRQQRRLGAGFEHSLSPVTDRSAGFSRIIIFVVIAIVLLVGGAFAFKVRSDQLANKAIVQPSDNYKVQDISLQDLINTGSIDLDTTQSLSINGQLRANNSLVIAPTSRPTQATTGQLYYDKAGNVLAYYDGVKFVDLAGTDEVAQLRAQIESVRASIPTVPAAQTLPQDIATQSGQNTFTGDNSFTGSLDAAALSLSGAAILQSTLTVNGTANLATVSASGLTVSGSTTLGPTTASSLVLSSPLGVASGGTGANSLASNGVLIGQGTAPVGSVTASGAGLCLISTTGAPVFQACPGGSAAVVDSLNGLTGNLAIQGNAQISVSTAAPNINLSIAANSIGDAQLAFNTGQDLTVSSTPQFNGVILNNNITLGGNSIVTSGGTIGSAELEVLDGGILESEVTGVITDVTAGNGLTGGAAAGNATVNIASANGGITVNADNIALTLQPSGDGLSGTTSSGSGLEVLAGGLSLLQGCGDGQILKWNETTDSWSCAADAGGSGVGDDVFVNGLNANAANFIDTVASGSTAGIVWGLNTTPSPNEVSLTVSNASATQAGVVTTGIQSFAGDKTFNNAATVTGLFSANGGVAIETGDTFTFNGDAFTDLTGTGLTVAGGVLQTTLGTTIDSSEITDLTITGADIANDAITDTQLAFNTGQHLTVTSTPIFAGVTLNGNLSLGANGIVTSGATIGSAELDVLDGGITEGEVTGVITDVTAGNGLTGGAAAGNATVNIASANGGIAVNADNIALVLQPTGDGLSATTSSGSGLEILAGGLALLQGCSDGQTLKWNEAADTWGCAADAGSGGLGDDISVNGANATNANFIDTVASGTIAGVAWSLNTTPSPDDISVTISNASVTQAGVVTTGVQSFAGDKTFSNAATITGLFTANGGVTVETGDTFTFNGDAFTDLTGTGLLASGGILQTTLGVAIDSSEITDLTITGADIADDTIALGTKTTGNYQASTGAGTGLVVTGTAGEGWTPTISLDYTGTLASNSLGINQSSFAATGLLFEGATADGFETLFTLADPTADNTITLPNQSGTVCLSTGNCPAGGNVSTSGGTANSLAKFTSGQNIENSTITDDGTNVTTSVNLIVQGGNVTAGTNSQLGSFILTDGNGQTTTLRAGDSAGNLTFTLPTAAGSQFQCLKYDTGGQLIWDNCDGGSSGGSGVTSLNSLAGDLAIQGNAQIGVSAVNPNISLSINADSIGDSQLAFNTGQHLTTASAPSFAGLTLTGDLNVGSNNIVTGLTTISSAELDVLDGGITESEVTGVITDVTAGTGLTGGAAAGSATLNVASANGGIAVNADNIALTLQPTGDALSGTTSSGSGLEILSTGLSLIQGCADAQILKWNETTDTWGCSADAGGSGLGDDVLVNGSNADGANLIDSAATGTSAGTVWNLNTTPSPDEITLTVSNASATQAGVVTTGVQSFAGDKTFNNAAIITGLFTANGGVTIEAGDTFTFNGDAFTDLTGTGLTISGGALQTTLGTNIDSSEIVDGTIATIDIGDGQVTSLKIADGTVTGTDIANTTVANSNLVNSSLTVTAGNGLANGGSVSLGGTTTLDIASANGAIAINADNIALTLQPTGDALSSTTSAGSGLEILAGGLSLLQGCSDAQILKWNEAADTWGCAADAGGSGLGDDVLVNGLNANAANFINTVVSGTTAGVTWNLNTTPSPNEVSLTVSNASATDAGVVTTGVQSFAGTKTFTGQIVANGGINLGTQTLQGTTAVIDFSNFDVAANGNTTVGGTLTVTGASALNGDVTVAAGKSLTITGGTTGTRPASPVEGMVYYDTTTKQLLTYANGKWQADRSTATKIVGTSASGSGAVASVGYDGADYVNTSATSAQTVINTALSSMPSGGTVYLMEGTYVIDGSITIPNNVTLTGTGNGTVIRIKDASPASLKAITNTDVTTGSRITIENITIDGNSANNGGATQYGIYLDNMGGGSGASLREGARISDVTVRNIAQYGIYLNASNNNLITGVSAKISSGAGYGIMLAASSSNNTLTGNAIHDAAFGGIAVWSSNNTVTGNTIRNSGSGIYIFGANNVITGNTTAGNLSYGIRLYSSNNNTVSGNNVYDNGGATTNNAIYLSNGSDGNTISGNTIADTSATTDNYAIHISDAASDVNYLSDNTLGTGTINNLGTGTIFGGQVNTSGNYYVQPAGTVELMKNTNITGTLNITSNVDTNGSLTVGNANQFVISNTGVVTSGTWQGGSIQDAYLADNITISAAGTVDWAALNNYPAACGAGQAITQLGDTVTCTAFAAGSGSGNYIQNQFAADQTADFRISGTARANTAVVTPALRPVADSTTALNIQNAAGSTNILTVDSTNARIGIGTTPSYKLHVADTTTANSGTSNMGAYFTYTVNPSSAPAATTTYYGQQTLITSSSANLNANVTMYGDVATVQNAGSATLGAAVGTGAVAQNAGTGVVTNAIGGRFKASNVGAGSITNGVALQASTPEVTAGSIGTAYGLLIETQDVAGVGTGYGIWQAGAADLNVFAGKVGIGMIPSTHALEVNGTGLFGTSVLTPTVDTYSAVALNIGTTNATQINLNKNVVVAANQSLTITGGATGTRPASPTEGMVYYDTTTKQLLTYANGKWQADRTSTTKTVAPSTAAQYIKDTADYVATGTNDHTVINSALTAAAGGKVYLFEGTFTIGASISVPNNTTLSGAGNGTIVQPADVNMNMIVNTDTTTGTGVVIRDMKLDGRSDINTANNQQAVYFNQMGNTASGATRPGGLVTGIIATRFSSDAFNLIASDGNQFRDNHVLSTDAYAFWFDTSENNTIADNVVQDSDSIAVTNASKNTTVTNNQLKRMEYHGIYVDNSDSVTVTDNKLDGAVNGVAIYNSAGAIVSDNALTGAQYGVRLDVTNDSLVTGNVTSNNSAGGILLWGAGTTGNTISGNTSTGDQWGIYLDSATNNTVDGNTFTNSSAIAILLVGADNTHVSDNRITNSGSATANDAIIISFTDNATVSNNTITDSSATSDNYAIEITSAASENTYLSGNTLGTGSINNLGTGTIFGGQVNNAGNYLLQPSGTIELLKNTNVTGTLTATTLASTVATGTAPITVNSTTLVANLNSDLLDGQHGSYYQNASNINAGTLAVANGGSGAGTFTQYGILFGNGTGAFGVTAAGTTGQCLLATTSAAPTWGACTATNLQGAYNASSGTPLISLTDGKDFTINAADTTTDPSIVFNLQCVTCSANGGRFAIQDAGVDIFTVNPNGDIIVGTGGNTVTFGAAGGYEPILAGNAQHTKKIVLTPEYVGAVLDTASDASCTTNNSGTMTSAYDSTNRMNYYNWMSTQTGAAHCYDVIVQVPIPSDWAAWTSTPIDVRMKKDSTGTAAYAIQVLKSDGNNDATFCSGGYCSPGTITTSWANMTTSNAFAGTNYTAGDYFTIKIRMSSQSSANTSLGNITLTYKSKW